MLPAILLAVASASIFCAALDIHEYDDSLFHFKSRPDIKAPKYEVEVYNASAIARGYWFVGPYETLNMDDEVLDGWIGPAIYDGEGNLIYSGAPTFDNSNTEDFKLSNVGGEEMFTIMDQSHWEGVLMDRHYVVKRRLKVGGPGGTFNSHEFNFVENGTRALVVYNKHERASREESALVGYEGRCKVGCNGIAEYNTAGWETTFEWDSCDHIHLNESTDDKGNMTRNCERNWDYVHMNSIDKTPEGDFLFSCRHADAIFKVSHKTGEIIWRLGGKQNDFQMIDNLNFTRQHHIRFRGYNGTHTFISLLDNALGQDNQEPSADFSRGLWLALDEQSDPQTAHLVAHFDHPLGPGHHSNRRGSLQLLPNGNILMGWSERGQMTEHLRNGTMVMRAYFAPRWLGTYRSYKLSYVGEPARRPDAAAEALAVSAAPGGTRTAVYASWNGATEVAAWNFYKTNPLGHHEVKLGSAPRAGFETNVTVDGFAKYVVVEAVHADGTVLGRSGAVATSLDDDSTEAVAEEEAWQDGVTPLWWKVVHSMLFLASAGAVISGAVLFALVTGCRRKHAARRRGWRLPRRSVSSGGLSLPRRGRFAVLSDDEQRAVEGGGGAESKAPLMEGDGHSGRRESEDDDGDPEQSGRFVDEAL